MANYELLYTLPAKYTEGEIADLKNKITAELTKLDLKITRNDEIGKIKLAYPMQHVRYGHYVLVNFEAEPAAIARANDFIRLHSEIIRHQIVKPEAGTKLFTQLADPEARIERHTETVSAGIMNQAAPVEESVAKGPAMSSEELDKRLTALEEDITKEL